MISITIFPGRYMQGYDALKDIGGELAKFGDSAFVICDPFVYDSILPSFKNEMESKVKVTLTRFGGECTDEEIDRLSQIAEGTIVGIGGGKTLDTAKAVAHQSKAPVVVIPTTASTDAPCSALAVIYNKNGTFKRYLILPKNPDVVLVDTKVIAEAPVRFLVSGMGDALATWFEAESARKKHAKNMAGGIGSQTAYNLARICYDTLIEFGVAAKIACEAHAVTPALAHIIEANTLLSGLGFESGGLAAAHAIHNGLTVLEQTHTYYHGEKVAFGTLASLHMTDKPAKTIDEVYGFCEDIGLPTTFADIGLENVTEDDLWKIAEVACAPDETIHNEPIPITPDMVVSALKAADAYGEIRKEWMD